MRIKITIHKWRGLGLIWVTEKYHVLWLEWADGALALPNGGYKIMWITPRLRYVHI